MSRGLVVIGALGALLLAGHVGYVVGAHGTAWHGGFGWHGRALPGPVGTAVDRRWSPPPGYSPFGRGDLQLGVDQVRAGAERILERRGNPRLKLGEVKEVDADAITADIVTKDGNALVERLRVDRHTGFTRPEEN